MNVFEVMKLTTEIQDTAKRRINGLLSKIYCFSIGINFETFTSCDSEMISFKARSNKEPP